MTADDSILEITNFLAMKHHLKLCRFCNSRLKPRIGMLDEESSIIDLGVAGMEGMTALLERDDLAQHLEKLRRKKLRRFRLSSVRLLTPVERQEVWAAGVTYLRSKVARMDESDFSASAYGRVYDAERPELFFKSLPEKVVHPEKPVGIRKDARWSVPEPELALVINSKGSIAGYTIGNDMSSRDIEGENLLYLPQAKIYDHSCAVGPFIVVGASETEARSWKIRMEIHRDGREVFRGETAVDRIKRPLEQLAHWFCRSQTLPNGAVLLTGTGIVPPDDFTLREGDGIRIHITGIGDLRNRVVEV